MRLKICWRYGILGILLLPAFFGHVAKAETINPVNFGASASDYDSSSYTDRNGIVFKSRQNVELTKLSFVPIDDGEVTNHGVSHVCISEFDTDDNMIFVSTPVCVVPSYDETEAHNFLYTGYFRFKLEAGKNYIAYSQCKASFTCGAPWIDFASTEAHPGVDGYIFTKYHYQDEAIVPDQWGGLAAMEIEKPQTQQSIDNQEFYLQISVVAVSLIMLLLAIIIIR